jgi:pimeloyl-ACP methyl ester carboxylesterase
MRFIFQQQSAVKVYMLPPLHSLTESLMLKNINDLNPLESLHSSVEKVIQTSQEMSRNHSEAVRTVSELSTMHLQKLTRTVQSDTKKIEGLLSDFTREATKVSQAATPNDWLKMYGDFMKDAVQRQALMFNVLRQRGNVYTAHLDAGMPPVLDYQYEVVVDGKDLVRPVNYLLLKLTPPQGVVINPERAPVLIIDPRAGHGAGIGGFKQDSQVGDAFADGHPVYFVAFRQMPEPAQTIADVRDAEIHFLRLIAQAHPQAPKPILMGNCQGGWAAMLVAAKAPELVGPIVLNGSPMSYWAGNVGENPMRYTGGLVGGATPALLMSDLGHGLFDGVALVENFESLNPANTYFKKYYNLYSNIDAEAQRFIDFERWWGGYCFMTEAEIRWIVENLFVGNKLAAGEAVLNGERVDLRQIQSPIIVFASHGDNITPPPQALNWIADLYSTADEIKARGQRIVYMLHDTIGHLGIFVSAKIAGREHEAITDTIRAIEAMAPGLYEMKLEDAADRLHIRFEPRTIDDILHFDVTRDEEVLFSEVRRMSEVHTEAYERAVRPVLKHVVTKQSAELLRNLHPLRTQRLVFSDKNPIMSHLDPVANKLAQERVNVADNNPFLMAQQICAGIIEMQLNLYRDLRDAAAENSFFAIYTSPLTKAMFPPVANEHPSNVMGDVTKMPEIAKALADIELGGLAEATVRMLHLLTKARGYVRRTRLERELLALKKTDLFPELNEDSITKLLHIQSLIVDFAPKQAISTLTVLLSTPELKKAALQLVMDIAGPRETMHPAALKQFEEFEGLLS